MLSRCTSTSPKGEAESLVVRQANNVRLGYKNFL
jgi:hypothetical protein